MEGIVPRTPECLWDRSDTRLSLDTTCFHFGQTLDLDPKSHSFEREITRVARCSCLHLIWICRISSRRAWGGRSRRCHTLCMVYHIHCSRWPLFLCALASGCGGVRSRRRPPPVRGKGREWIDEAGTKSYDAERPSQRHKTPWKCRSMHLAPINLQAWHGICKAFNPHPSSIDTHFSILIS
jgi:hypothetical protein